MYKADQKLKDKSVYCSMYFKNVPEAGIFYVGKDTYVKRPNNGAANAFNLDTGKPTYIYAEQVVSVQKLI